MRRVLLFVIPLVLLALVLIFSGEIIGLTKYFPPCLFYSLLHLYCPGCGNTRSIIALLHGDILGSLRYNVIIIFLCLLAAAFYIENAVMLFSRGEKNIQIVPRNSAFLFVALALFLIYFVVRNFIPYLTP